MADEDVPDDGIRAGTLHPCPAATLSEANNASANCVLASGDDWALTQLTPSCHGVSAGVTATASNTFQKIWFHLSLAHNTPNVFLLLRHYPMVIPGQTKPSFTTGRRVLTSMITSNQILRIDVSALQMSRGGAQNISFRIRLPMVKYYLGIIVYLS